ncbi:MAG: alpha/beta hydrolase [Spirochaetota bacterium]
MIYSSFYYKPMEEVYNYIENENELEKERIITEGNNIILRAKGKLKNTALIYYPGAKVDPLSYVIMLDHIAKNGYRVIIPKMPYRLAIFGIDKAETIIKVNTDIEEWVLGGHSLGGAMASVFAYDNEELLKALIIHASYPPQDKNLSNRDFKILSIYGTEDRVIKKDFDSINKLLPSTAEIVKVKGGNHAQFGHYGEQSGDGKALISRKEQQDIIIESMLEFLDRITNINNR